MEDSNTQFSLQLLTPSTASSLVRHTSGTHPAKAQSLCLC